MIKIITLILLFSSNLAEAKINCEKHPIYCQIVRNSPKIDRNYAMDLSNIIHKAAITHNIKPYRLTAILAQESRYRLNAVNHKSRDYGISQINHRTIEAFGFDKEKLLTDLEYSVIAGAKVLADFKRMYAKKEDDWWTRYNASSPEKREKYKQMVMRYM